MANANRSFYRSQSLVLCVTVAALAGCTSQGLLSAPDLRLDTFDRKENVPIVSAPLRPTRVEVTNKGDIRKKVKVTPAALVFERQPAWCDYLRADTAAQTTIMRSPTLSGSVTDEGQANVSLSMSLTDLAKARVLEETAETRCRRHLAESGLQKLIFLSPQELTGAGFRAKSKTILSRRGDIEALRRRVAEGMRSGDINRETATQLKGFADQLMAEAAHAKSEADRRTSDFLGTKDKASLLGRELMRAEADLEDLNSRMRTFDNVHVSVATGWSDDVTRDKWALQTNDFSARMSVSVKLGTVLPGRFEHEARARQAKLRSISEEGGTLWQVNVLRLAHERAIEGLVQAAAKIDAAIAENNRLLAALKGVPNREFTATSIRAQFQAFQLQAEKAAIAGSLAEIRTNLKRLANEG